MYLIFKISNMHSLTNIMPILLYLMSKKNHFATSFGFNSITSKF